MSHWKKKITAFSLAGKGSIIYKSGRQSPKIGYVGPEKPMFKEACEILSLGYTVTPQKVLCMIESVYVFAYRLRLTPCQITSVGEIASPSKFVAPITSSYEVSVA